MMEIDTIEQIANDFQIYNILICCLNDMDVIELILKYVNHNRLHDLYMEIKELKFVRECFDYDNGIGVTINGKFHFYHAYVTDWEWVKYELNNPRHDTNPDNNLAQFYVIVLEERLIQAHDGLIPRLTHENFFTPLREYHILKNFHKHCQERYYYFNTDEFMFPKEMSGNLIFKDDLRRNRIIKYKKLNRKRAIKTGNILRHITAVIDENNREFIFNHYL